MGDITRELLQRLPKTDLHCHLDGSMRLRTILDLAEEAARKTYGPASIEQAVKYCHAHRIGHGTRLIEAKDPARLRTLYRYFKDKRIPLEICVTSNVQTGSVPSIEAHPLKVYLVDKLRCTICTDNRLVSDTTVTDEYFGICQAFKLSREDLHKLIIYGFESTFLPYEEREGILREVEPILQRELHTGGNSQDAAPPA